jgi:hypothetical protein
MEPGVDGVCAPLAKDDELPSEPAESRPSPTGPRRRCPHPATDDPIRTHPPVTADDGDHGRSSLDGPADALGRLAGRVGLGRIRNDLN